MIKKQYKVKIENGQVIPLEPFDMQGTKEGIIIFFEYEDNLNPPQKNLESLKEMIGMVSEEPPYKELTAELIDKTVYDEL